MSHFKHGFATVKGNRVHFLEAGDGAPLVLLHTGGASAYEYEHVIGPLSARHRVIAWDMPGHGDSDRIINHHSIEDYRDALAAFAGAMNLDRFALAGSSIGGYIALAFGAQAPQRLTHNYIIEAPLRSPQWYAENWAMFEAMCAIPETPFEALAPRLRALTPELHKRWNMDRFKAGSWTITDLAWAARDFDAVGALKAGAKTPTTIVLGAKGPTVQEKDRWASIRPDAAIVVMDDCGHFPMIDDPAGFVRIIQT